MATLYVDRQHAELRYRDRRLELRVDGRLVQALPLSMLERVVVVQAASTDTRTLARLAAAGIGVSLLSGRGADRALAVVGVAGNDARRRLAQYAAWHSDERRTELVRALLRLKLHAQYRLVRHVVRARPDRRVVLEKARRRILALHAQLDHPAGDVDALRGIEGAASAAGFEALGAVMPPALGFTGRRRRPAPDPVNAVLSLGYTLAMGIAVETVHAAGLDPAIGYLHAPAHDRPSLALDVMEPLRPRIERMAWELFRKRRLTADHFRDRDGACLLGKAGRALFYDEWESRQTAYRRWCRRLVMALVRRLQEETSDG